MPYDGIAKLAFQHRRRKPPSPIHCRFILFLSANQTVGDVIAQTRAILVGMTRREAVAGVVDQLSGQGRDFGIVADTTLTGRRCRKLFLHQIPRRRIDDRRVVPSWVRVR